MYTLLAGWISQFSGAARLLPMGRMIAGHVISYRCGLLALVVLLCVVAGTVGGAQPPQAAPAEGASEPADIPAADQVEVRPQASDAEIADRVQRILQATGWFQVVAVRVDNGVAFLEGQTGESRYREWAEETARRTTDVVAVVNRIEVETRPIWDLTPAVASLQQLARETVHGLPLFVVGVIVAILFVLFARLVHGRVGRVTGRRMQSVLLGQVVANVVALLVLILGTYIALRVSGLTRLAVTVLGGTGLVGLAIGFAFRDIAENYLSSILISLNRPFRINDFIEIEGTSGFVQRVTTRGTMLMTIDGNHVQIPNSTVYKSTITNFSANPKIRQTFAVRIGLEDSISHAQEVIFQTLSKHVAILSEPPPSVLVERLGPGTVELECILWVDVQTHSPLKVKSAAIRQTKRALHEAGISLPDGSREVSFPQGVPVRMLPADQAAPLPAASEQRVPPPVAQGSASVDEPASSDAEGHLDTEATEISRQAANCQRPDAGTDLLTQDDAR
jgi:small conductance mechanosensitive channel